MASRSSSLQLGAALRGLVFCTAAGQAAGHTCTQEEDKASASLDTFFLAVWIAAFMLVVLLIFATGFRCGRRGSRRQDRQDRQDGVQLTEPDQEEDPVHPPAPEQHGGSSSSSSTTPTATAPQPPPRPRLDTTNATTRRSTQRPVGLQPPRHQRLQQDFFLAARSNAVHTTRCQAVRSAGAVETRRSCLYCMRGEIHAGSLD